MSSLLFFFLVGSIVAFRESNQKLKTCCARQKTADKECKHRFCDFDAIRQDNMLFFLNTCKPRGDTVKLMWDCASSKVDHTQCCKNKAVHSSCLPYCQANHQVPDDYLKHVFCLQNFNGIRDCFREYLDKNPNIFGDK